MRVWTMTAIGLLVMLFGIACGPAAGDDRQSGPVAVPDSALPHSGETATPAAGPNEPDLPALDRCVRTLLDRHSYAPEHPFGSSYDAKRIDSYLILARYHSLPAAERLVVRHLVNNTSDYARDACAGWLGE